MHVAERLRPQVQTIIISANRNLERYAAIGSVATDGDAGVQVEPFAGPLLGVLSGLRCAHTPWVVIVPCDAPNVPPDLVQRLFEAVTDKSVAVCARAGGAMQPAFALVHTSVADTLQQALVSGERALHHWFASLNAVAVDFADERGFANINTAADIEDGESN
jgi:molybdopterin-guanine dinucleotide biosynthesis protein A